ncbi:hypothetical protein OROGR_028281 [Orobanche gracilis]
MQIVQFVNLSEWCISLQDETGLCFLSDLKPGKSRNKCMFKIPKRAFVCGNPNWRVGVLKDGQFANISIHGYDIVSRSPRITFKTDEDIGEGKKKKKMLRIEGIQPKPIDGPLRLKFCGSIMMNNLLWNKRPTILIARYVTVLLWSSNGAPYGAPLHTCRESNGGCRTHHHR